jgi:hypothetical protein
MFFSFSGTPTMSGLNIPLSIKKECEHPWVDYLNTWITPWPIASYIHRYCHRCFTCWICESFIHLKEKQKDG